MSLDNYILPPFDWDLPVINVERGGISYPKPLEKTNKNKN